LKALIFAANQCTRLVSAATAPGVCPAPCIGTDA
jgi:hypothetical protein